MFHDLARDDVFRLETPRLWLRWPQAADAPALAALAGERGAEGGFAYPSHSLAFQDSDHFIRFSREDNARGAALRFALTLKGGQRETVGVAGIETVAGRPVLGFWLDRLYWGRGLASEAAQAVVDAFFHFSRADGLEASSPRENEASRRLLEKLGFVEEQRPDSGAGRQAKASSSSFILRRQRWQARDPSLPRGLRSVTA